MATTTIHQTAIVDPGAQLGDNVSIGPYCVIGPGVAIGDNVSIGSHSCFDGPTTIGSNNRFGRNTCIGADPQDLSYQGEECFLIIGGGNTFGDFVQVCRGTSKSRERTTRVGNNNFIMAYVHVGHDCVVGNQNVIANAVQFAGHVETEDYVHIGGLAALHQFGLIGCHSMVSGGSSISGHVPPYVRVAGYNAGPRGMNQIGLQRSDRFTSEDTKVLRQVYRIFFKGDDSHLEAVGKIREKFGDNHHVEHFCRFIERCHEGHAASRPIVRIRKGGY